MTLRLTMTVALALAAAGQALALDWTPDNDHPCVLVDSASDISRLQVRCGLGSAAEDAAWPNDVDTHLTEWATLKANIRGYYTDDLVGATGVSGTWGVGESGNVSRVFGEVSTAWLIANGTSEQTFADSLRSAMSGWMADVATESRAINSGALGDVVTGSENDDMWETSNHLGLIMAYSTFYDLFRGGTATENTRHREFSRVVAYTTAQTTGKAENPKYITYNEDHMRAGHMASMAVLYGDSEVASILPTDASLNLRYAAMLDQWRYHAQSWGGAYFGYVWQDLRGDYPNALVWSESTTLDVMTVYGAHYQKVGDFYARWFRANGQPPPHTGDNQSWDLEMGHVIPWAYHAASEAGDGNLLDLLDQAWTQVASGVQDQNAWLLIILNDKGITRVEDPAPAVSAYSEHLGNLDPTDGNSPYTFFRSDMAAGSDSTVWAYTLAGDYHTDQHSSSSDNGTFIIGRGDDVLASRIGAYDGTAPYISGYLWRARTIAMPGLRVIDHDNSYYLDAARPHDWATLLAGEPGYEEAVARILVTAGNQLRHPDLWGGGAADEVDEFHSDYFSIGKTTRFKHLPSAGGVGYVFQDITRAYPNNRSGTPWEAGAQTLDEAYVEQMKFIGGRYSIEHYIVNPSTTLDTLIVGTPVPNPDSLAIIPGTGSWGDGTDTRSVAFNAHRGTPGIFADDTATSWYHTKGNSRFHQTVAYPSASAIDIILIGGRSSDGLLNRGSLWRNDTSSACQSPQSLVTPYDPIIDATISYEQYDRHSGHNFKLCADDEGGVWPTGMGCNDCGSGLKYSEWLDSYDAGFNGPYRVEVEYGLPSATWNSILIVNEVTDSTQTTTSIETPTTVPSSHIGAQINDADTTYVVILPVDEVKRGGKSLAATYTGPGRFFVTGLIADTYSVEEGGTPIATVTADTSGVVTWVGTGTGASLTYELIAGGAGADTSPPTPCPPGWSSLPAATGQTTITMTAGTVTDPAGVQYRFHETSGNPGGTTSGWQSSASYTDVGLTAGTTYSYRIEVRDGLGNTCETLSTTESATTDEETASDTTAPSPNPATFASNPRGWSTEGYSSLRVDESYSPLNLPALVTYWQGQLETAWAVDSVATAARVRPGGSYEIGRNIGRVGSSLINALRGTGNPRWLHSLAFLSDSLEANWASIDTLSDGTSAGRTYLAWPWEPQSGLTSHYTWDDAIAHAWTAEMAYAFEVNRDVDTTFAKKADIWRDYLFDNFHAKYVDSAGDTLTAWTTEFDGTRSLYKSLWHAKLALAQVSHFMARIAERSPDYYGAVDSLDAIRDLIWSDWESELAARTHPGDASAAAWFHDVGCASQYPVGGEDCDYQPTTYARYTLRVPLELYYEGYAEISAAEMQAYARTVAYTYSVDGTYNQQCETITCATSFGPDDLGDGLVGNYGDVYAGYIPWDPIGDASGALVDYSASEAGAAVAGYAIAASSTRARVQPSGTICGISMQATEASDAGSPPVEYSFEAVTGGGTNSGWIPTNTYVYIGDGTQDIQTWRTRTQDQAGNRTGYSSAVGDTCCVETPTDPPAETPVLGPVVLKFSQPLQGSLAGAEFADAGDSLNLVVGPAGGAADTTYWWSSISEDVAGLLYTRQHGMSQPDTLTMMTGRWRVYSDGSLIGATLETFAISVSDTNRAVLADVDEGAIAAAVAALLDDQLDLIQSAAEGAQSQATSAASRSLALQTDTANLLVATQENIPAGLDTVPEYTETLVAAGINADHGTGEYDANLLNSSIVAQWEQDMILQIWQSPITAPYGTIPGTMGKNMVDIENYVDTIEITLATVTTPKLNTLQTSANTLADSLATANDGIRARPTLAQIGAAAADSVGEISASVDVAAISVAVADTVLNRGALAGAVADSVGEITASVDVAAIAAASADSVDAILADDFSSITVDAAAIASVVNDTLSTEHPGDWAGTATVDVAAIAAAAADSTWTRDERTVTGGTVDGNSLGNGANDVAIYVKSSADSSAASGARLSVWSLDGTSRHVAALAALESPVNVHLDAGSYLAILTDPGVYAPLTDTLVVASDPDTSTFYIDPLEIPAAGADSTCTVRFYVKDLSNQPIQGITVTARIDASNTSTDWWVLTGDASVTGTTNASGYVDIPLIWSSQLGNATYTIEVADTSNLRDRSHRFDDDVRTGVTIPDLDSATFSFVLGG